ncbi:sodium/glucose cotransporter [Catenovulum agarivorans DS-2]|uniref:Sodium/glucose cotransporter n=1 Tax=Catenovulum agarivorans DS-2 TaxID=1328313 RepID=W7QWZ2_9ALTE|nr:sodium/solute symporter [Catenovulum agarivorans]EWH09795.1 sodium/glucose cotransporter [Catenovulum agarivorans DS-2]
MTESIALQPMDWFSFIAYFALLSVVGYLAGRRSKTQAEENSEDYFLAGRSLPWYVVGASYIAANISTEHFIGLVGAAFIYGISVATGEWSTVIAFTFMIWIFIPFLFSAKVFTAPEFLERRFNTGMRVFFAIVTVIANIFAFLAPVIYGGGLALDAILDFNAVMGWQADSANGLYLSIALIGFAAGIWAIWGGLKSVAWMDLLTIIVMVIGGLSVTIYGLSALGHGDIFTGFSTMVERNTAETGVWQQAVAHMSQEAVGTDDYQRLSVIQPLSHQLVPWSHWVLSFFYIGLWYTVINQFLIQRVFAAKNVYHARMGITFAAYLKLLLPFIVVIPGLIYFAMRPDIILAGDSINDVRQAADQTYITLIVEVIPYGLQGLLMAALFGAIQSTVSAVLTSTSAVITMDFYKRFINQQAKEHDLVVLGRLITFIILIGSIALGIWISTQKVSLFAYIQELFTFFAPPFSAVFLLGTFWKRVGGQAALITVSVGFIFGIAVKLLVNSGNAPDILAPYANQGILNWMLCMLLCTGLAFVTAKPRPEQVTDDLTFNFNSMNFNEGLGEKWYQHVGLWSGLSIFLMVGFIILFSVIL